MRIYALWTLVLFAAVYAWRRPLVGALVLIFLSVFMQRPEFPTAMAGIPGLNPWNFVLVSTTAAWILQRRGPLDLPKPAVVFMLFFLLMIVVACVRALLDFRGLPSGYFSSPFGLLSENLINRVKYVVPAMIVFDSCRSRRHAHATVITIIFSALAYAGICIRRVPPTTLLTTSESIIMTVRDRIDRDIGLHAIDFSMLMAACFWATAAYMIIAWRKKAAWLITLPLLTTLFLAMAAAQSRGSFIGWTMAAIVLGAARWRRIFLIAPVALIVLFIALPSIPTRLGMGVAEQDVTGSEKKDWEEISSGRTTRIWPAVIDEIAKSPVIGYGGEATLRVDTLRRKLEDQNVAHSHPHNAYLELLIDMGVAGALPVVAIYGAIFLMCWKLFRRREDALSAAIGGMGLSAITVLMVTAMGAQSFYPTQSSVLLWPMWALALRATLVLAANRRRVNSATGSQLHPRRHAASPGITRPTNAKV